MKKLPATIIEQEYSSLQMNFEKFNNALLEQLKNILESENITLGFPVQTRIKTLKSVLDKVESGRFTVKKSIRELQDIIGFRIILIFKKDVEIVKKMLRDNLEIVKQYSSEEKLLDDQFGYSSEHFIVKIPKSWSNVPTFKGLDDNIAEIQIRTLSQHTWAEASKELQYKQEDGVPRQLLRSISRVSALLETVDLEFERLLNDREKYIIEIAEKGNTVNQKLNVDLIASILDATLPTQNKRENEPYFELLEDLEKFDILTKEDLENVIKKHLKHALTKDKETVKEFAESPVLQGKNYFFTHSGLLRLMLRVEKPGLWEELKEEEEKAKKKP